jgi:hypothetical protein
VVLERLDTDKQDAAYKGKKRRSLAVTHALF